MHRRVPQHHRAVGRRVEAREERAEPAAARERIERRPSVGMYLGVEAEKQTCIREREGVLTAVQVQDLAEKAEA